MADIERVRVIWSGAPGMPGVSTFYSLAADGLIGPLGAFFFGIRDLIPDNVTLQVQGDGDKIDDATGTLIGTWADTVPDAINCTGSGPYAAPVGVSVQWLTEAVVNGHHVKGRTYLVPLCGSQFEPDGSPLTAALATIRTLAQTLVDDTAGNFLVWHRPGGSPVPAGAGVPISGVRVSDISAVLRSRRD